MPDPILRTAAVATVILVVIVMLASCQRVTDTPATLCYKGVTYLRAGLPADVVGQTTCRVVK